MLVLYAHSAIEIRRQCFRRVHLGLLRSVRVNHRPFRFRSIPARSPFHTVTLTPAEVSVARFKDLVGDDARRRLVNKVNSLLVSSP
jgi:hypothetical protein